MQNRIAALEMECAELRGQVLEWKQIARDAATVSLSSQFERRKALPNAVDEMVCNRLLQRIVSLSGRGAITKSQEEYLNMLIGSNDGIHSTNTATSEENLTTAMSPTGTVDSDDVVLGFLTPPGAGKNGVPLQTLFAFERVHVKVGETVSVLLYRWKLGTTFTQVDGPSE